jgi:cell shape-determining protein MreC
MAFLTSTNKSEGSVSKLAMFFALIFVAIGILIGAVLERLDNFRKLATKVRTLPRLLAQLKEKMA